VIFREREREKEREGEGRKGKVREHICDDVKYAQHRTDSFLCIKRRVLAVSQVSVEAIRFSPSPHFPRFFLSTNTFMDAFIGIQEISVARAVLGF